MDRFIYTVGNALTNLRDVQAVSAQNLSNMSVPGFRRDLPSEGSTAFLTAMDGMSTRAFQISEDRHGFDEESGFLDQTGEKFDIAISQKGYFFVKPEDGPPALSRRGDLSVNQQGNLVNGANEKILDQNMRPIVLPPFTDVVINELGEINIQPPDAPEGERVNVGMIGSVVPDPSIKLSKGLDGQIRQINGQIPAANQQAKIQQGVLERSNVNTTEELINAIDLQRNFELNMRMVQEAKKLDESGARLLQMPDS